MPRLTPGATVTDVSGAAAQMRGSVLTRIGQAVRYAIRGVTSDTWMSPNQPIAPVAQQAVGRRLDYQSGYNLVYTPRAGELTSFAQLRALAENCDLVHLCIETRKAQMSRLRWDVQRVDHTEGEHDDTADRLQKLFRRPDGTHTWEQWVGMLVEETLVTDAAAIYPRRTVGGQVIAFEMIDGATIKVLTDALGRTPDAPSPAYQQVIKGLPAVDYTVDELVYAVRNPRVHKFYGCSPVEQIALTVNVAIRRSVSQLQYFTSGNIPEAFATVPTEWSPQQIEQFQTYWDTVIEGDQSYKRKVRFVPGQTKVTNLREAPLKDAFDDWLARVVTYAFQLPPTHFTQQATKQTSDALKDASESDGQVPLKAWIKGLVDRLIEDFLGVGGYEFVWVAEDELDPVEQQKMLSGYASIGAMTVNEVRAKLGMAPVDGGHVAMLITQRGAVPLTDAARGLAAPGAPIIMGANGEPEPPAQKSVHTHLHKAADGDTHLGATVKKLAAAIEQALEIARDAAVQHIAALPAIDASAVPSVVAGIDTSALGLMRSDVQDAAVAAAQGAARSQVSGLVAAHEVSAQDVSDALQITAPTGTMTPDHVDLLSYRDPDAVTWAEQHVGDLITSDGNGGELADATRNLIRRAIVKGLRAHLSTKQIADQLHDDYAFSSARAALIARTEVRNAEGMGNHIGAARVGMSVKKWMLSHDDNPCPVCVANSEQPWMPIDQPFEGGVAAPLQHPRCRCVAVYRRTAPN